MARSHDGCEVGSGAICSVVTDIGQAPLSEQVALGVGGDTVQLVAGMLVAALVVGRFTVEADDALTREGGRGGEASSLVA